MKHYPWIFFDLDGTLTDPGEGITNSVAYALEHYGISVEQRRQLYSFIGPPLRDSFMGQYGFSQEQATQAIDIYREYYRDRGIWENRVYPGIPELLGDLCRAGRKLALATSKPELFARQILEHFRLEEYFTIIAGADMAETRVRKAEVIAYALAQGEIHDPGQVLMVGDREHDVLGAGELGMDCLGVLFGYGSRQELEAAGAVDIAATVEDLRRLLLES